MMSEIVMDMTTANVTRKLLAAEVSGHVLCSNNCLKVARIFLRAKDKLT